MPDVNGNGGGQGLSDLQLRQMRNTVVEQRKKAILERFVGFIREFTYCTEIETFCTALLFFFCMFVFGSSDSHDCCS